MNFVQTAGLRGYAQGITTMASNSNETTDFLRRARNGDWQALVELFTHYRERLRRMVHLRLDRRLQGRVDPSDVLRAAVADVSQRATEYLANPALPVYLWLRTVTGQRLQTVHRQHLGPWTG